MEDGEGNAGEWECMAQRAVSIQQGTMASSSLSILQQNLHLTSTFHTETGLPKISVCPGLFPTLPPALLSVCPNTTAPEQTLNLV